MRDYCRTDLSVPRTYAPRLGLVVWNADCLEPRGAGQQVVELDSTTLGLDVLANEPGATLPQADPYDEQLAPDHGLRRADHAGEHVAEAALALDADDDRKRFPAEAVTQLRCLAASDPNACTRRSFEEIGLAFEPDHSVSSRDDCFNSEQVRAFQARKKREWQQIRLLADRLQQDLSSLTLQSEQSGGQGAPQVNETLAVAQTLLADLQSAEPVGRMVIDLERVLAAAPGPPDDVTLRGGNRLRIPKWSQEVTVIGEVQNSTSHHFDPALTRDDYLRMSGGTTQKADDRRSYVVRANGSIASGSASLWFRQNGEIRSGDTIVVPLDAERMRPLPMWTATTSIIFNLAVAVAAANSF